MNQDLKLGDIVTFDLPDNRWWVRVWAFLRGRPSPVRCRKYIVTEVAEGTPHHIQPAIMASLQPHGWK